MPDLTPQIEQSASDPAAFTSDGQSATARPVGEIVQADQYLAQKAAARRKLRGVAITTLIAPGALDDSGRAGGCGFDRPGGC